MVRSIDNDRECTQWIGCEFNNLCASCLHYVQRGWFALNVMAFANSFNHSLSAEAEHHKSNDVIEFAVLIDLISDVALRKVVLSGLWMVGYIYIFYTVPTFSSEYFKHFLNYYFKISHENESLKLKSFTNLLQPEPKGANQMHFWELCWLSWISPYSCEDLK